MSDVKGQARLRGKGLRIALACALAAGCAPAMAAMSTREAHAASALPTKIVNGDFQYTGMTRADWDRWHSAWPNSINRNEVPASVVWPVDSRWVYIFPGSGQYGALAEGAGRYALAGFDAQRFGWKSDDAGSVIEIRRIGAASTQYWTELVAETAGKYIYQDVRTTPGTLYKWSLKHAASASGLHHDPSQTSSTDSMQVMIGSQSSQIAQSATRIASNGIDPVGVKGTTITSSVRQGSHEGNSWNSYAGTYIVPAGQSITRFTFKHAGTTASWTQTGNRVDDIHFAPYQPLIYDLNGGAGTGFNTTIAQAQANDHAGYFEEGATRALSSSKPTRAGYTFLGWSKTRYGNITSKAAYDSMKSSIVSSVTIAAGTNTVYAVWGKNPTATFTDGIGGELKRQTVAFGGVPAAPATPQRQGYTFTAWSRNVEALYSDAAFDARWRANRYQVVFDANGGAGQMAPQQMTYDEAQSLSANAFTRAGTAWQRWCTARSGAGSIYGDAEQVENLTAEDGATVTLYAQWAFDATITFEDGWGETLKVQTVPAGSDAAPPAEPQKPGYLFTGWTEGYLHAVEDATVYATWEPVGYRIAFDANGGAGQMDPLSMEFGKSARLPECGFSRDGWRFTGWSDRPSGEGAAFADRQHVRDLIDADGAEAVLYAQWTSCAYDIVYEANGGTGRMAPDHATADEPAQLSACAFRKAGDTFQGWALAADGAIAFSDCARIDEAPEDGAVLRLYAVWEEDAPVLIRYQAAVPAQMAVENASDEVLPRTGAPRGSRARAARGYRFDVWSDAQGAAACTEARIVPERDAQGLYASATYVAQAEPISYATRYDANGGTGEVARTQCTYDVPFAIEENGFERDGYRFCGWSTLRSGTGTCYEPQEEAVNLADEEGAVATLYAVWEPEGPAADDESAAPGPSPIEPPSEDAGADADAVPEAPQEPEAPDVPAADAMLPISLEASLDDFGDPTVSTGYGQAAGASPVASAARVGAPYDATGDAAQPLVLVVAAMAAITAGGVAVGSACRRRRAHGPC